MVNNDLSHVTWIGGSPCSGKSSMARLLTEKYDLAVYNCDDHFYDHMAAATPENQPELSRLSKMGWDEIWMRPVAELVQSEVRVYGEEFPMILDDLRAMPRMRPILAEGAALMPELVQGIQPDPCRSMWVVPSEAFQREYYPKRGEWVQGILSQCSDPQTAFANWMARDAAFGEQAARTARAAGLYVLIVTGERSIAENAALAAVHFGL